MNNIIDKTFHGDGIRALVKEHAYASARCNTPRHCVPTGWQLNRHHV